MKIFNHEGKYRARLISACLIKAKSGTDQVLLSLKLEGIYMDEGGLIECPKPRYPPEIYLNLTEATMAGTNGKPGWVAETLKFLGFKGDFDMLADINDQTINALCKHEEDHQGELVERWSVLVSGGVRQVTAPPKKETRRLTATWGSLFKGDALERPKGKNGQEKEPRPAKPAARRRTTTSANTNTEAEDNSTIPF
jgi:hypothetical protein